MSRSFFEDRSSLYDNYYKTLVEFCEKNLVNLKPNIEKISLGLTGGYDSRLTVAMLNKICKKHDIPLLCYSYGPKDHPDGIIGKKISDVLNREYKHVKHSPSTPSYGKLKGPKTIEDYMQSFYLTQGDFNSNDFFYDYDRKIVKPTVIKQVGMDAYKRFNENLIYSGNRWYARTILFRYNFFLPLFYTKYEVYFALLYGNENYRELIYEILKRSEPELLKIPFVGCDLPQANLKAYSSVNSSKFHPKEPCLWDYNYVKNQLKSLLIENLNKKIGINGKVVLKFVGLNELDFFLNQNIYIAIQVYKKNEISLKDCIKQLVKEKSLQKYPKEKINLEISKEIISSQTMRNMIILMDFASVADKHSFEEIENTIFNDSK